MRATIEKGIEIGGCLTKEKARVGHGAWLGFIEDNLDFSARTAERYIAVFENREALKAEFDNVSNFTITDAYRALNATTRSTSIKGVPGQTEKVGDRNEKTEIIQRITSVVVEGLEKWTTAQLQAFEADLCVFKQDWLRRHGAENATKTAAVEGAK